MWDRGESYYTNHIDKLNKALHKYRFIKEMLAVVKLSFYEQTCTECSETAVCINCHETESDIKKPQISLQPLRLLM